ncbi:hypothetical protein Psta_3415 [Pirellula staleyi DSM 6068]|uniref:DUF2997 domain-containing protein n=1 Tax=Pirellula staleyi (strain ATCC 27377 / DSM 6068 / ICPB 4128) TaxID=530564 RepID=D2QY02_PIRSD|nr:DUF2997 domain-containing protein [Pirellula staleyi]ADB18079.1 hypothetical protein Psta_3415 [Pirellula staleyi DSM 6068]
MSQIIEVIISTSGQLSIHTKGIGGQECKSASAYLEQALGAVTSEKLTSEFYTPSTQQQSHEGRAG